MLASVLWNSLCKRLLLLLQVKDTPIELAIDIKMIDCTYFFEADYVFSHDIDNNPEVNIQILMEE